MTEIDKKVDWECLLSEYGNKIFNTIYCLLGNYHETEDVFQEVFTLAYLNRHRFRGDSQPGTWLYRIAMNAVKAHIKRNKRHLNMVSESAIDRPETSILIEKDDNVESVYIGREINQKIQKALLKLPVDFRNVFVLSCIDGYSYKEIACILGVPLGTGESRLFRAKDRLRKELSDLT